MSANTPQTAWETCREQELAAVVPLLKKLGFELEKEQPHIAGERYLMQAVTTTSGRKLILIGRRLHDDIRVLIKVARDQQGVRELEHERLCRRVLQEIHFAYQVFLSPTEIFFGTSGGYMFSIQAFITQEKPFLARPIEEQFILALKAFKAQEGAHATTYGHEQLIKKTFGTRDASGYVAAFTEFKKNTLAQFSDPVLIKVFDQGLALLQTNQETIEQYSGFLTHTDFVPHNFRIVGGDLYLLDYSSLRFGNKYEGWARFLNFMALYHPQLQEVLQQYVQRNRTPEEFLSLKLMRVYRLGEIIWYYTNTLSKCVGDLRTLNEKRVEFWTRVLEAVLEDRPLTENIREDYQRTRDRLRSDEEKARQKDLH